MVAEGGVEEGAEEVVEVEEGGRVGEGGEGKETERVFPWSWWLFSFFFAFAA